MSSRWPFYASLVVLACACASCFVAAVIEWNGRGAMAGTDPAEATEQARFAIQLGAIGGLNLLATIAFVARRSVWTWWLVLGIQAGAFGLALIEGVTTDLGWFYFSGVPLLTLLLLVAFRVAPAWLDQPLAHQGRSISS